MDEVEVQERVKDLENKLKLLTLEREDTLYMLKNANIKEIKVQADFYEQTLGEIRSLQREVKQAKIKQDISVDEIKTWDHEVTTLKREEEELYYDLLKVVEDYSNEEKREEEYLCKLELEKLKLSQNHNKHKEVVTEQVRLPKLIITKFQGTHFDWWRFWNQFEAEVDNTKINQVTKFSYLKELLLPRVRLLIDGLPFTSEGYERAKNILRTKYGQMSEVVNAHVQKIINLPVIHGTNPSKVFEFYETLVSSVQTLESLGKLADIKGYVRVTLDKVPNVRPQLVQLDDNWKQWEFPDLVEAL